VLALNGKALMPWSCRICVPGAEKSLLIGRVGPEPYIYGECTVFSAGKSPNIRSYTVYIYGHIRSYMVYIHGSGQPYS